MGLSKYLYQEKVILSLFFCKNLNIGLSKYLYRGKIVLNLFFLQKLVYGALQVYATWKKIILSITTVFFFSIL